MNKQTKPQSSLKLILPWALAVIFAGGIFFVGNRNTEQQFSESAIENFDVVAKVLDGRLIVEPAAGGNGNLSRYVGLAFLADVGSTDFNPDRLQQLLMFRPKASDLESEIINQPLFTGKVERGSTVNGNAGIAGISISESQIAEVIIKDEMGFSAPVDQSLAKKLAEAATQAPLGKELWYIESATLTSVTYKTFTKNTGKQSLDGTAFKANGEFYSSNEQFRYEPLVSLRALPISSISVSARQNAVSNAGPNPVRSLVRAKAEWQAILRGEEDRFTISDSLKVLPVMKASKQFSETIPE